MATLEQIAGVDPADPEVQLALELARGDRRFLRELVRERRSSGMSQANVAERLGITQPTVAAFERHDSDPRLSTIRRYAQVVGIMVTHQTERRWETVPVKPTISTQIAAVPAGEYSTARATVKVSAAEFGLAA